MSKWYCFIYFMIMNREGWGFCEIEFDKYVFIIWKKIWFVCYVFIIISFIKELLKILEGGIEIWFGFVI